MGRTVVARPPARGEDAERLARLLEEVPPFSVLHPEELRILARKVRRNTFLRDEVIYREGEPSRSLCVIDRGQVKLTMTAAGGRERLVAILGHGHIFGELEMFDGASRGMTARAKDEVEAFVVDRHLVQAVLRTRPAFVRRLLELLARRLRRADQAAQDLVFFDAQTRLARRLIDLAADHGTPEADPRRVRIGIRLTQEEVGQMIGVNRGSVNRALRALTADGLIDWNGGLPVVLDISRLAEMARS